MSKSKQPPSIADQLRRAIRESGLTHYRIAKDAGIRPEILDRFVSGERDVRLETAAKVARALDLELRKRGYAMALFKRQFTKNDPKTGRRSSTPKRGSRSNSSRTSGMASIGTSAAACTASPWRLTRWPPSKCSPTS